MPDELDELIKQDHRQAELLRLDMGMDGCGCADCQDFYKTIDLAVYGARVQRICNIILINPGARITRPASPPEAPEEAQNPQEGSESTEEQGIYPSGDVTALTPTQHIIDNFINDSLAKEKPLSRRAIAAGLKGQGITISFMTVHRRIKDMREKEVAHAA